MTPDDRYGSDRSLLEKLQATVEERSQETRNGRPACYYVRYADGDFEMEPGTFQNHIVFNTDIDTDLIDDGRVVLYGKALLRDDDTLVEDEIHIDEATARVAEEGDLVDGDRAAELVEEHGAYIPTDQLDELRLDDSTEDNDVWEAGDSDNSWSRDQVETVVLDGLDARDQSDDDWTEQEMKEYLGIDARRPIDLELDVRLDSGKHYLTVNYEEARSEEIVLTAAEGRKLLEVVLDALSAGVPTLDTEASNQVYEVFREAKAKRVRPNVVENFLSKYAGVLIDPTDEGWVIGDTFVVTYDGENYLVDEPDTHELSSGSITNYDDDHPFLKFTLPTVDEQVYTLEGEEIYVSAKEQRFLVTVELLMNSERYLGVDTFERQAVTAIQTAFSSRCPELEKQASKVNVKAFVDPVTGFIHRHDLDKHTLTSTFGVTRRVVNDLHYSEFDHAGCHELLYREEDLREAEFSVFYEHDNDDDEIWNQIERISQSAKVHQRVHDELASMYGQK